MNYSWDKSRLQELKNKVENNELDYFYGTYKNAKLRNGRSMIDECENEIIASTGLKQPNHGSYRERFKAELNQIIGYWLSMIEDTQK